MILKKVVITGGPCAGKTTAMSWIQNHFTTMGYKVLFIPETATELIGGGVCPWTCGTNLEYQKVQLRLQQIKEELFEQAAKTMPDEKILIVCDRGIMDNKAYMNEEEFQEALAYIGGDIFTFLDQYDAVFHLVTAAKGAEKYYTFENNAARYETVDQARDLDDRLLAAWTGHPHLRVIDNSTDFEGKLKKLINEMIAFLGEPRKIETKRKFLIRYPDVNWLENHAMVRKVDIIETYLVSPEGKEYLVHQRGEGDHYVCYESIRRQIDGKETLELERRMDENRYLELLESADPKLLPIHKTRYYLPYRQQYFEIDLYPEMKEEALLELEVGSKSEPVSFPEEITIIREVTDDAAYRKRNMAKQL